MVKSQKKEAVRSPEEEEADPSCRKSLNRIDYSLLFFPTTILTLIHFVIFLLLSIDIYI